MSVAQLSEVFKPHSDDKYSVVTLNCEQVCAFKDETINPSGRRRSSASKYGGLTANESQDHAQQLVRTAHPGPVLQHKAKVSRQRKQS